MVAIAGVDGTRRRHRRQPRGAGRDGGARWPLQPRPSPSPSVRARKARAGAEPLVMVTAYDAPGARMVADGGADLILVGDSVAMVVLGYDDTLSVTVDDLAHHTAAVARGLRVLDAGAIEGAKAPAGRRRPAVAQLPRVDRGRRAQRRRPDPGRGPGGEARGRRQAGAGRRGHRRRRDPGDGPPRPHARSRCTPWAASGCRPRTPRPPCALVEEAKALQAAGCFAIVLEGVPDQVAGMVTDAARHPDDRHRRRRRLRRPGARVPRPARPRGPAWRRSSCAATPTCGPTGSRPSRAFAADVRSGAFPSGGRELPRHRRRWPRSSPSTAAERRDGDGRPAACQHRWPMRAASTTRERCPGCAAPPSVVLVAGLVACAGEAGSGPADPTAARRRAQTQGPVTVDAGADGGRPSSARRCPASARSRSRSPGSTARSCRWCLLLADTARAAARGADGGDRPRARRLRRDAVPLRRADTDGGFWMRNTPLPLSIAYLDADGGLVRSPTMDAVRGLGRLPGYPPSGPYLRAVEVPVAAGGVGALGIEPGARLADLNRPCSETDGT